MRIGLDIDGVMYRWQKTALYMLRDVLPNSPYGKELCEENWSGWNWPVEDGLVSREHWKWLWDEGIKLGLFRYGHLYPGTIQAVRHLATLGDVELITHRPKEAVTDTLAWLGLLNLPLSGLHLLTNQEPKSIVKPECDVYLDDKPENVVDLFHNTSCRVSCMMSRPWNSGVLLPGVRMGDEPRVTRVVHDWPEFIQVVEDLR